MIIWSYPCFADPPSKQPPTYSNYGQRNTYYTGSHNLGSSVITDMLLFIQDFAGRERDCDQYEMNEFAEQDLWRE